MHPEMFFAIDEGTPEVMMRFMNTSLPNCTELVKACAEEEDAEDKTGDGLQNVEESGLAALTLGILEADAPHVVGGGRNVSVLDGIRVVMMTVPTEKKIERMSSHPGNSTKARCRYVLCTR